MNKKLRPLMIAADGSKYRLVILKVLDTYDDRPQVANMNIPAELLFVDDDDVVEISGDERFVTAYVPISIFGMPSKGDKQ